MTKRPPSTRPWTGSETARLRSLYDAGYNLTDVADELKTSKPRVKARVTELGLAPLPERHSKRRRCMRCPRWFMSRGPQHRMCHHCRDSASRISPFTP